MVAFVAQQIGGNPAALAEYGRRDTNRREHAVEAQRYLGLHPPVREDRRAALTEALAAASASDKGMPIAEAIIAAFRARKSVVPAIDTLDRIGRAARVVARRRMEAALLDGLTGLGFLTLSGGRYQNTPEASAFLVKGKPSYLGGMAEVFLQDFATWQGLPEAVKTGLPSARNDVRKLRFW